MSALVTIGLLAEREVRQRLRSKLFVGTTLLLAVLLTGLAAVPSLVGIFDPDEPEDPRTATEDEPVRLGVLGELTSEQFAALEAALGPVETVELTDRAAAEAALEADEGAVVAVVEPGERVLVAPGGGFVQTGQAVGGRAAEALAVAELLADDPDRVGPVLARPSLPVETVGDTDPAEAFARVVIANLGVVFLFAVLIMYSSMIINGVIEEKGSRVVELLVAAVPVRWLMAGKLLGLGIVGLGQTLVLFGPPVTVLVLTLGEAIPPGVGALGVAVAGWFVVGYALYSVMAAGLGALVSRPEEAQAVLTPANVLMIGGYFAGFAAVNAPTSTFAVVASFVPFSAPYAMLVRQALADPAWWEVALAAAGALATAGLLTVLAARIYEGGILRVGARVRLSEAWSGP